MRVLCFSYHQEQLVLLNAYDKPDNYSGGKKKKVDREIEETNKLTQTYYEDFLSNPDQYEKYEQ